MRIERLGIAIGGVCLFSAVGGLFGEPWMMIGAAFGFGFGYFIAVKSQKKRTA